MNQRLVISSALATVMAMGLAGAAGAADAHDAAPVKGKEKCFGVAKAGQNDCANLSGSHACAGMAKADGETAEWMYVAKGTCKELKGLTQAEAKAKLKK
jgi:uncharacterized membrane protein